MILVDTSVWIDHLRVGDERLSALLAGTQVMMHPFVLGELACGNLRRRTELLNLLKGLPQLPVARDDEVLFFIDRRELMGRGIGYVDVHLLAALAIDGTSQLWTSDKRLCAVAEELGLAYTSRYPS